MKFYVRSWIWTYWVILQYDATHIYKLWYLDPFEYKTNTDKMVLSSLVFRDNRGYSIEGVDGKMIKEITNYYYSTTIKDVVR